MLRLGKVVWDHLLANQLLQLFPASLRLSPLAAGSSFRNCNQTLLSDPYLAIRDSTKIWRIANFRSSSQLCATQHQLSQRSNFPLATSSLFSLFLGKFLLLPVNTTIPLPTLAIPSQFHTDSTLRNQSITMAGPRAPIGTLSQHAETAAKLAKKRGQVTSVSKNAGSKKQTKSDPRAYDSDSSDSESDESSDSDSSIANIPMGEFMAKLKAESAKKKAKEVRPVSRDSSDSDAGSSSGSSSDESTVKPKKTNKSDTTSSGSSSDESDPKAKKVNLANKKADKKGNTKVNAKGKATTKSDSESDSETGSSSDSDTDPIVNVVPLTKKSTPKPQARSDLESEIIPDSVEKNSVSMASPDLALARTKTPETIVISSDNTDDDRGRPFKAVAKQNGISKYVTHHIPPQALCTYCLQQQN